MLLVVLQLGMWFHVSEATPLLNLNTEDKRLESAEHRLKQIEQIKSTNWTTSDEHQIILWKWYWDSRLDIQYDDPDVFERIVNIQIDLAYQYPEEVLEHLKQSSVLPEMAWTILRRDHNLNDSLLSEKAHKRIQMNLAQEIEESAGTNPEQWLRCWKSSGGSVGMELFRFTLVNIHQELKLTAAFPDSLENMYDSWGLQNEPVSSCPVYKPGQSYQQPIPKEPDIDLWKPEPVPSLLPFKFRRVADAIGISLCLAWCYRRKRTLFFALVTPVLIIGSLEGVSAVFVTPLIETKPMFQFQNWSVEPWIETETDYLTQGDYLRAQRIPKTTNQKRLVVLGASSAHGSNELMEDSFAGIVEQQTEWDVVNLGIGGTTSAGLVSLMPYVEKLQPDALIIYYGHNEVYQLRKLNEFHSTSLNEWRWKRILWSSHLYTLLYNLLPHSEHRHSEQETPFAQTLSEEYFIELAANHFSNNMSLVLSKLEGVPTLLVSPPTNYPFAPMEYTPSISYDYTEVQNQIDAHKEATTIHSVIRTQIPTLAATYQTSFWDLDWHFHRYSPDGLSANGLFWDELHPSSLGHQWIARGVKKWLHGIEVESDHVDTQ